MIQIMKKRLYSFMMCLLATVVTMDTFSNSKAQEAKIEINEEMRGFHVGKMSTNGRYITCIAGNNTASSSSAVWDRETGTITSLGIVSAGNPSLASDVSNDGVVVGNFMDPEVVCDGKVVMSGGWWKDNVWHSLGVHPDHPISGLKSINGSSAVAISCDGEYIAGYVFKNTARLVPCMWKRNEKGEYKFHKEYVTFAEETGKARPWDISDSGQVLAGWDERSVWKPTIWTDSDKLVCPEGLSGKGPMSLLQGINPEGTIAVGIHGNEGVILGVDGSFRFVPVKLNAIASNGMVTTYSGIWTERLGAWELIPYLKKFWNIDVDASRYRVGMVWTISGDGRHIGGYFVDNSNVRVPFVVTLGEFPVALPPDVVNTTLKQVAGEVVVDWEKPLFNGYEPIGYNVYKGDKKLNVDGLLTAFSFTDKTPDVGANCYHVTAVYQYEDKEEEGGKSMASCVEVIDENGCFSPKHLAADIIYNRTVNLSWGMPLPNYGSVQPSIGMKSAEPVKIKPNYLKTYELQAGSNLELHPASDGNNIYLMSSRELFFRYTVDGDFVHQFKLGSPYLPNYWGGLTYNEGFYYTASIASTGTTTFKLDLDNKKIEGPIMAARGRKKARITYMPHIDNGNGGFEVGNDTSSYFYKKDLKEEIGKGLKNITGVCGTAYHDGKIYATVQNGGEFIIKLFDATTGEYSNEYIDLKDYTNLKFNDNAKLGGISTFKSTEGILCLVVVVMDSPNSQLVFLQLEDMEGLLGYDVYRNGTKVNKSMVKEGIFSEDLMTPGVYKYTVKSLFDDGCVSEDSFPVDVTIDPIGICNVPKDLTVELIRNNAQVTWKAPKAMVPHKLVGYNLYRNDEKLNTTLLTSTFYTDTKLPFGEYSYQVEAFYSNSCMSDKTVPTVANVKGFNVPTAPTNLTTMVNSDIQATLKWNEPAIGNYANLRWYNGAIEWGVGEEDEELVYVGSKWDADDLSLYFDYTLTDVEFYPMANTPHTFYIYIDGKVVSEQYAATVTPKAFNLLKLDRPIPIEKGRELMVAYKVAGAKGIYPIGADMQSINSGKGDLISYDGKTWKSLYKDYKTAGTWAVTIRLMPYTTKSTPNMVPTFESCDEGRIVGSTSRESKSEEKSIFVNREIVGYNVYRDSKKIGNTAATSYEVEIDNSKNSCYAIEAVYTSDRVSHKTEAVCIYGECRTSKALTGKADGGTASLTWETPVDVSTEDIELRYCSENMGGAMVFGEAFKFYALIQSTVIDNAKYNNIKLKSIEALVLGNCKVSIVAIQDGKILLQKVMPNVNVGEINTFEIPDGGLVMDPSKNIMVGLFVDAPAGASIGVDSGPGVNSRGDIIGQNVNTLTTLPKMSGGKLNCNWNIAATFEQTVAGTETVAGYNIYRNGIKIDTSNTNSFKDETVVANTTYEYYVRTLWSTGCESVESNRANVSIGQVSIDAPNASNISIFPNPAKNKVNIRGEYSTLKMYTSAGMLVLETGKSDYINVSALPKGVYIVELSNEMEVINRVKLMITE